MNMAFCFPSNAALYHDGSNVNKVISLKVNDELVGKDCQIMLAIHNRLVMKVAHGDQVTTAEVVWDMNSADAD